MTDRELLEAAARAVGLKLQPAGRTDGNFLVLMNEDGDYTWNPLTDDGDAFRLAVKLRIDIHFDKQTKDSPWMVCCDWDFYEPLDAPGCDAEITRRAIVRAAAALTPSMESKE